MRNKIKASLQHSFTWCYALFPNLLTMMDVAENNSYTQLNTTSKTDQEYQIPSI